MSSPTSMRWLMIAILCLFFTRSPSCSCSTCPDARSSSRVIQRIPHNPVPSGWPLPPLLAHTPHSVTRSPQFARLRRSTLRPRYPVSLARCYAYYILADGLSLDHAVSRCTSHRDQAVTGGRVLGSHILLPPPAARTLPITTPATRTTPTPRPRPRNWRQGAVPADRPGNGVGMVLRDDLVQAVVDSSTVKLGYKLLDLAKPRWRKLVRSTRVWYRRLKWFIRISIEEEDLRNGNILGLLWFGSWLVAARPDQLEESESEVKSEVIEVAEVLMGGQPAPLMIEWYHTSERGAYLFIGLYSGPRTLTREDVLTSMTLRTLSPTDLVPPRTRLAIEWYPDQSQSAPATASRRPRVRPGRSVYQPPAMQTGLTEERRFARSEARRQVLEQAEREAQEPVPVPEDESNTNQPRRKKIRGGVKVQARRAARKERLAREAAVMK